MNDHTLNDRNAPEPERDNRPTVGKKRPEGDLPPLPKKDEPHRNRLDGDGPARFRRQVLDGVPFSR